MATKLRGGLSVLTITALFALGLIGWGREAGAVPVPCGPNWENLETPNVGTGTNALTAVSGASSSDVWAVGHYEVESYVARTLILHWDGGTWAVVDSPSPGSGNNYLTGVAALSATDVWAVGHYSDAGVIKTLILHWNGVEWSTVPSPNTENLWNILTAVDAGSSKDVWAVGYTYAPEQEALILHWDGASWTIAASPKTDDFSSLTGVAAIWDKDVWAVGHHQTENGFNTLTEHWDGTAWSVVKDYDGSGGIYLLGVTAAGPADVWAVGGTGDPREPSLGVFLEHWNGSSWSDHSADFGVPAANHFTGAAAVGEGDVWAVGDQSDVDSGALLTLSEHWDGAAWVAASSPNIDSALNAFSGVTALPSGELWAVGSAGDIYAGTGRTLAQQICPIKVGDEGFHPRTVRVRRGTSVAWSVPGNNKGPHTVTDATGLELFDSGLRLPGSSFVFTFTGAGTYQVIDAATGNQSVVRVPISAAPNSGGEATEFRITWASERAPLGYTYDVQIKRPGSPSFEPWLTGTGNFQARFVADAGIGAYSFRARVRVQESQEASGYSAPTSIRVG